MFVKGGGRCQYTYSSWTFDGPLYSDRVIRFHPNNRTLCHPSFDRIKETMLECGDTAIASFMTYWKMDDVAVGMLNTLMEHQPFYTVVSSTWRALCSKEVIQCLFEHNNLELKLHKDWATGTVDGPDMRGDRLYEIADWLKRHKNEVEQYIILDDVQSGGSLPNDDVVVQAGLDPCNIVLVDANVGMEQEHYFTIRDLLDDKT